MTLNKVQTFDNIQMIFIKKSCCHNLGDLNLTKSFDEPIYLLNLVLPCFFTPNFTRCGANLPPPFLTVWWNTVKL